jgi:thiamine-phosphate pyrophosphorylase
MPARCLFYYITDRTAFAGDEPTRRRRVLDKVAEAARAGVDYIQLREKGLPTRDLESLACEAVKIIEELRTENCALRTAFLINSRTDVAIAVRADGVHLRSEDLSPREVREIWKKSATVTTANEIKASSHRAGSPPAPLLGVSCHSPAEVAQAGASGASFAVFAPIFEKRDAPATPPGGLAQLQQACRTNIPVLALGGVTLANARSCLEAGAKGIAAIRLFQANEIERIVRSLRDSA